MPTEILQSVYQVVLPTPFPVGPVNCYVSTAPPITLFDTGTRCPASQEAMFGELKSIGLTLGDIQRIIISHPHPDHYGMAAEIVRQSGAQVWSHPSNRSILWPTEETRNRNKHFYHQLFLQAGVPQQQLQQFLEARAESRPYTEPVAMDGTLDEGDHIEFGGHEWIVHHTPGHSGGLICLFTPEHQILLSNDHLLQSISSNPVVEPDPDGGPRPHRLVQYLYHMQRMADLKPCIAWTGHGPPIHDVAKVVRQRLRFHQRRASYICDLLRRGEMSSHQLSMELFGTRRGFDFYLALSETIGHLDWLMEQGLVQAHQRDEVLYWQPTNHQPSSA